MYQRIKSLCSNPEKASGPGIEAEMFFSDPVLQEDCTEYLTTASRKEYSRYISELLDRLGYSYDIIKYRQQAFEKMDMHSNSRENIACKRVTTGGKGEGTALYFESDIDSMFIVNDVICADYPQRFIHKENITLFHTERQETLPGYTRLRLLRFDGICLVNEMRIMNSIKQSLFKSDTGSHYLSSQSLTNTIKTCLIDDHILEQEFTVADTSGPSTPLYSKFIAIDDVMCFKCFCPDILERWVSRPRRHGWPCPHTIHEVSLLDGHVVPVGLKGSQNMFKEWRICYSLAELYLMRNFNETQLKVYVILKQICKSILNPISEEMTSYIMKNVTFWMCEAYGIDKFTNDLLMDRLFDCVKYLRSCVSANSLPSYMIPDRNLLAGRLDIQQSQQLTSLLSDLLHEGGRMLLRVDKLRDGMLMMHKIPDIFRKFGEKRDNVESLKLMGELISVKLLRPEISSEEMTQQLAQNDQYYDTETRIFNLIKFDTQALRQDGKTHKEITDLLGARLTQLLA